MAAFRSGWAACSVEFAMDMTPSYLSRTRSPGPFTGSGNPSLPLWKTKLTHYPPATEAGLAHPVWSIEELAGLLN